MTESNHLFSLVLPSGLTVRRTIELTLRAHGAARIDLARWEKTFARETDPAAAPALLSLIERAARAAARAQLSAALLEALPACLAALLHARLDERAMNACATWLSGSAGPLPCILSELQILVSLRILSECAPEVDPQVPVLVAFHSGAQPAALRGLIVADATSLFLPADGLALLVKTGGMKTGLSTEDMEARLMASGRIRCRARLLTDAAVGPAVYLLSEEWLPRIRSLLPEESLCERIEWTDGPQPGDEDFEVIAVMQGRVRLPRALPARARLQIGWAVRETAGRLAEFPEARSALRLFWGEPGGGFSAADFGALFVPLDLLGEDALQWLEALEAAGSVIAREERLARSGRPALLHVRTEPSEAPRPGVMFALRADWNAPLTGRQIELLARFRRSLDEAEFREENLAGEQQTVIPAGLMKPISPFGELEPFFPGGIPEDVRAALSEPAALHLAHLIGRARLSELAPALAALADTLRATGRDSRPEGAAA